MMVSMSLYCPLFGCAALGGEKEASFNIAKEIAQPFIRSNARNKGKEDTGRKGKNLYKRSVMMN